LYKNQHIFFSGQNKKLALAESISIQTDTGPVAHFADLRSMPKQMMMYPWDQKKSYLLESIQ
jgi:hypothetical protein